MTQESLKKSYVNGQRVAAMPVQKPETGIPPEFTPKLIRGAWFAMAHMVLERGSTIANISSGAGAFVFTMALLNPQHNYIGICNLVREARAAEKKYILPNLRFMGASEAREKIHKDSLDGIINRFDLHEVYSAARCNDKAVVENLEEHMNWLKPGGTMFIQDFAMPETGYVLMEFPEEKNILKDGAYISIADLLVDYSQRARPFDDPAHQGFYLEELPARFPRTRLFRLPSKWAYEFALRKDDLDVWEEELHKEYTFYTERDFRRAMRAIGARALYTAPHWDETEIKKRFDKKFRIMTEDQKNLGPPATSFVGVLQKMGNKRSLVLQERRPIHGKSGTTRIIAMRNEIDGTLTDIVCRGVENAEVLPYRITDNGRLHIFVHEGLPRGLANAVPRGGENLDKKKWSGHMLEALTIPQSYIHEVKEHDPKSLLKFARDYLGLRPENGAELEHGPGFYPAPDSIDERIETKYLKVQKGQLSKTPRWISEDIQGFSTCGELRELDAQTILNAIGVGLVPTSRLELQILALYEKLGIDYEPWADCPLVLGTDESSFTETTLQKIIARLAESDDRYKETRGTAGQFKTVQSMFVDEGQSDGGIEGLASRDMEFVITDDQSMNVAVALPLTRKINGEIMAGIVEQYLPVPQRYKGNGYVVSCPSFNLPKEIKNLDEARRFIAEQFEVPVECVARMGESYFCHVGVTPRRIYPFAVTTAGVKGWKKDGRTHGVTKYCPLYRINKLIYLDNYDSFMKVAAIAYMSTLGRDSMLSPEKKFSMSYADLKAQPLSVTGSSEGMAEIPKIIDTSSNSYELSGS